MTWDQILDHARQHYAQWPTLEIFLFEVAVIALAVTAYRYLTARVLRLRQHFVLLAIGVFLLEFFTGPMWENRNLGVWAYIYSDVSWIFTLAWTTLILLTVYGVDTIAQRAPPWQRFVLYLLVLTPVTLVLDGLTKGLGIRAYSPEVLAAAGPGRIPILDVPAAGLYYIPVFMTLVLSFYKHWLPIVEPGGSPGKRLPLVNRLAVTAVAVFLFEVVVEPMATNQNFPAWSYVFHDITIVMTGFWVALVTVCTIGVDRVLRWLDFRLRFAAYLAVIAAIATPIEGWFIASGYRVYGPSATADFIGIRTLVGNLPVEVVAAIPIYLALVISFVRYWDGSVDRSLGLRSRPREPQAVTARDAASPVPGPA